MEVQNPGYLRVTPNSISVKINAEKKNSVAKRAAHKRKREDS
jgi:hypothetical protein